MDPSQCDFDRVTLTEGMEADISNMDAGVVQAATFSVDVKDQMVDGASSAKLPAAHP